MPFHLAQANVALPLEPLDSARLKGFMDMLEPVNALADQAPGFVWRLQTEDGDATAVRPFQDDDRVLINMSVWESIEAFGAFVYGAEHAAVMRQRRGWFVPMRETYSTMWWIPQGELPTAADAVSRLDLVRRLGPSQDAFTIRTAFPPPGDVATVQTPEEWRCGV